jgi:hypothetical protein
MTNMKNGFLYLFCILTISSCQKGDFNANTENQIQTEIRNLFDSNSNWQLVHVFDLMKSMNDDDLVLFLNNYGIPNWEKAFQKRSNEIKITSIPMLLGDSITGIIKIFEPLDDSIKVDFFPVWEIDQAITKQLSTNEFHAYMGAVQSLIIS